MSVYQRHGRGYGGRPPHPPYSVDNPFLPSVAYDDNDQVSDLDMSEAGDAASVSSGDSGMTPPQSRTNEQPIQGTGPRGHPVSTLSSGSGGPQEVRQTVSTTCNHSPVHAVQHGFQHNQSHNDHAGVPHTDAGGTDAQHWEQCDICGFDCGETHASLNPYASQLHTNDTEVQTESHQLAISDPDSETLDYVISSLHYPHDVHRDPHTALRTAPWSAQLELHLGHPIVLVESFPWRQYIDRDYMWSDTITVDAGHPSVPGHVYHREICWDFEHITGEMNIPDRIMTICLSSKDAEWLSRLTPREVTDHVSLENVERVFGWKYNSNDPIHEWDIFFSATKEPSDRYMVGRLGGASGGLDVDEPEMRGLVGRWYEQHIRHPDEG